MYIGQGSGLVTLLTWVKIHIPQSHYRAINPQNEALDVEDLPKAHPIASVPWQACIFISAPRLIRTSYNRFWKERLC